jgi:hypothetical protein
MHRRECTPVREHVNFPLLWFVSQRAALWRGMPGDVQYHQAGFSPRQTAVCSHLTASCGTLGADHPLSGIPLQVSAAPALQSFPPFIYRIYPIPCHPSMLYL